MHTKINRTLATVALVLGIILMTAATIALAFTVYLSGSVLQALGGSSSEVADAPVVTEDLPSSGEVQGQEWWINENGDSCYIEPDAGETICEPQITE
jgi:hypothetical protein